MNLTEIGSRIKFCRKNLHMTQESLAEKINVSPHYIYEIERGTKNMSLMTLCKISEVLNVSTDFLLSGKKIVSELPTDELDILINALSCDHRIAVAKILSSILPYLK